MNAHSIEYVYIQSHNVVKYILKFFFNGKIFYYKIDEKNIKPWIIEEYCNEIALPNKTYTNIIAFS